MRVLGFRVLRALRAKELSAHAEVDDEVRAVLEPEDEILAEALHAANRMSLDHRAKVLGGLVTAHDASVAHRDRFDLLADHVARQRGADGFDFRELRHRASPRRRRRRALRRSSSIVPRPFP